MIKCGRIYMFPVLLKDTYNLGELHMSLVTVALVGAGNRGVEAYAPYALINPDQMKFVAVCEPDRERRQAFQDAFEIPGKMCFDSYNELLKQPRIADAVFICTQDKMHFLPTIEFLRKGYHILLEKPMSPDIKECILMAEEARKQDRALIICHVLRYTSFFKAIKNILESGKIGKLISIVHNENVGYFHQAHSFVRGNWRNKDETSPMILAKCCHDMDILHWLADSKCKNISSFGSLTHFKAENVPEGAAKRCLDGCKYADDCIYYAPKQYLTDDIGWPTSVISADTSYKAREKALKKGPYGRCVYHCDNNVVDNQVANMEFENGVTAAFTMCAFTNECNRVMRLMGTNGEIEGDVENGFITVKEFKTGNVENISVSSGAAGHSGGDYGIINSVINTILGKGDDRSSVTQSLQSHMMAFAAEKSRLEGRIVDIDEYIEEISQLYK